MADEKLFPDLHDKAPSAAAESQVSIQPAGEQSAPETAPSTPDLFANAPTETAAPLNMVNSVVSTNDAKSESILGTKPTSHRVSLNADGPNIGGLLMKCAVVAGVAVWAFFFTQLNPDIETFKNNPVQKLASFESRFETEQNQINLYNLLMAKFDLDEFNVAADAYLLKWSQYQSDYTENNIKEDVLNELHLHQDQMIESLGNVKMRLAKPLYPAILATNGRSITELENDYKRQLRQLIAEEKKNLTDDEAGRLERQNLDSVLALLKSDSFKKDIRAFDLEEEITLEKISGLFSQSTELSKNEFSTILAVKSDRVYWIDILDELERVTREIDPLYNSGIVGNVDYSNLIFNSADRTIAVRGQTRTDDSLNFSLLSDLIDVLEASPMFANIENRTFSKADSNTDGVTSAFSLNFSLQEGGDERDVVPAVAQLDALPSIESVLRGNRRPDPAPAEEIVEIPEELQDELHGAAVESIEAVEEDIPTEEISTPEEETEGPEEAPTAFFPSFFSANILAPSAKTESSFGNIVENLADFLLMTDDLLETVEIPSLIEEEEEEKRERVPRVPRVPRTF